MKVHLIYPNFKSRNAGGTQEPLGIMSLAAVLRQTKHQVFLTDLTFIKDISVIDEHVRNADVLGIGCSTPLFGIGLEILKRAKNINPAIFSIAGGPHATQDPADALQHGFDTVAIGEAEKTIVNLLACLDANGEWKKNNGIAYVEDNRVIENSHSDFIDQLDNLPFVARDLIQQDKYLKWNGYISLLNTRGCPYRCLFCKPIQDKLFGTRCRKRSPISIAEEIEIIYHNYGAKHFYFKDDTLFLCGAQWFAELKTEFDKRNLNVHWICNGRVDQVNQTLLKSMKEAGLEAVAFGVESGSQKILDFYRKDTTVAQSKEAFRLCHKLNILPYAFLMFGAPEETIDDLKKTTQLYKELRPYGCRRSITTPIPGNFLYEYAKQNGLIYKKTYREYDNVLNLIEGRLSMKLKHLTLKDIQRYSKEIMRINLISNLKRLLTCQVDIKVVIRYLGIGINRIFFGIF